MINERRLLLILAAINFTHILDFMIVMPLGTYLIPLFRIDPQAFSFIVSAYTFSAGISGFVSAFFVDRFDRKKVLLFGYMGFVLGTFICAFAPTYQILLLARVIAGMFGGLIGAQVLSIVADAVPFERRGRAMGTMMSAFSLASVVGVPFALFLAAKAGWHAPFLFVGGMGLLIIPMVMKSMPSMTGHIHSAEKRPAPLAVITTITSDPNQLRGLLLSVSLMLGHFAIIPFIATYMEFNVGFTKDQNMYVYLIGGLASFFTAPLIGRLADRHGKFRVLALLAVGAVVPIFLITNMPVIPVYYVLIASTLFFILGGGRIVPVQAIVSSVVLPEHRGSFMSFNASLQSLSAGLASMMAGVIVYALPTGQLVNYQYVGYIAIALSLLCIVIARHVKPVDVGTEVGGETAALSGGVEFDAG